MRRSLFAVVGFLLGVRGDVSHAQSAPAAVRGMDSASLAALRWRAIGPATMGGRIADIAGIPSPSKTFYVAAAGGGIWKTSNAGTTFRPVFDGERVVSMGALAIAPSDTNVVYAGTGEQNSRNSISPGGGVYKSMDGGATWRLVGLERTEQIARIVVDPRDAKTVYVAALGHAWGPNPERGLYKSIDGGSTWELVKFVSDRAGFIDVVMDPVDPNTLFASSYERVRGPWFLTSGGPGSALWKTTDAGKTWTEVNGSGFPATIKGRIGLAIAPSDSRVVYALIEADSARGAGAPFVAPASDSSGPSPRPNRHRRLLSGLYRSGDGGRTWRWMNDRDVRPFYYSQVRVDPRQPDRVYWSSTPFNFSDDGGRTVRTGTIGVHVDHHAMWIDPNDAAHFIVGNDGGVAQTWDRGGNYDFVNQLPIGQFYEVSFDMAVPYRVCGGLQDNGSWCAPSRKRHGGISNADWVTVGGGDGFYTAQDPTDRNIIYAESQGGNISRLNYATGERVTLVKPSWRPRYLQLEDSVLVTRGDTAKPANDDATRRIAGFRAIQRADSAELDLRFNWNTPFFLSPHAASTLYIGGNRVLKSTARGETLFAISPDLSTRDTAKIHLSMERTGGVTKDATGAETYGTITALAESPIRPGLLFAGTDDGNLWLTRNDGANWENLTARLPGAPSRAYVSRLEPSHFDSAAFFVALDNHRVNDFAPYVYVTTDFGRSFRSIASGLPRGGADFVHVVREDPQTRDLLFVGTDVGAYVSLDGGRRWQRFMAGLPTVPVHDLKIHPRDHELIAATHGRSIWIADIAPLEQWTDSVASKLAYLFVPRTAYEFGEPATAEYSGAQKTFVTASVPYGAVITYRLGDVGSFAPRARRTIPPGTADSARVVITNVRGDTLRTLTSAPTPGIHTVVWDFQGRPHSTAPLSPAARRDSIDTARKMGLVFDSLAATDVNHRSEIARIRAQLASGTPPAELFRRPREGGGRFVDRPAESRVNAPPNTRTDSESDPARGYDPEFLGQVVNALRDAKAMPSDFDARRTPAAVGSGDYLVTLSFGGKTMTQVLRVERVNLNGMPEGSGDEDDSDL
ncbi:MAG: hypothetical protein NVS4B3_19710 [Gemmatimonadaceae bacterium]